ncbi:uncharacterized protein LOC100903836 [Galendromus occidentalis]|uniref:Uncharacterized protein LOC100903836 n=1 Tax=Galendromus occidentalis TaxID=34638 RepID=A0AAJ6QT47_9ACAR|nr:uncharacterized protein LOC100903836 [Galendromus occidentalis]
MTYEGPAPDMTDDSRTVKTLLELQDALDSCQHCVQSLRELFSVGKSTVSASCLDNMISNLRALSLRETLETLMGAIRLEISGSQILEIYKSAQDLQLSGVLYETMLEKTCLYATFIPDHCSTLPFDLLLKLLRDDELNVSSEDDVLDLVEKSKSRDARELNELISCIRFPFLTCSAFDALIERFPEASRSQGYQICKKSIDWLKDMPKEQLTRRRHYVSHLHLLLHEDSIGDSEWEKLAVSCLWGSEATDAVSSTLKGEPQSVVEARSRCVVLPQKVVVGASSGSELWAWIIDTSSGSSLASPSEKHIHPDLTGAEFVDASETDEGQVLVSWRRTSDDSYHLGVLSSIDKMEPSCEEIDLPPTVGGLRSTLYGDLVIILSKTQLILFDRATQVKSVYDSPARSSSSFLDLIVISTDSKKRIYVFDRRTVIGSEPPELPHVDLLLVFDLDRLEWERDSWTLELEQGGRSCILPSNGLALFEYRGNVGILAELTEGCGIRNKIILVHDSDRDQFTEDVADIPAVTDEGLGLREVLGLIPTDMNPCAHESVFSRYCRTNSSSQQLRELRKLAE